jgi:hypothetical protein
MARQAMLHASSPAPTGLRGSSVSGLSQELERPGTTVCSVSAWTTHMTSLARLARPRSQFSLRPRTPDIVGHELEHCRKRESPTSARRQRRCVAAREPIALRDLGTRSMHDLGRLSASGTWIGLIRASGDTSGLHRNLSPLVHDGMRPPTDHWMVPGSLAAVLR